MEARAGAANITTSERSTMSGGIVVAARVDILLLLLLMTRLLPIIDSLWLPRKELLTSQAILYV